MINLAILFDFGISGVMFFFNLFEFFKVGVPNALWWWGPHTLSNEFRGTNKCCELFGSLRWVLYMALISALSVISLSLLRWVKKNVRLLSFSLFNSRVESYPCDWRDIHGLSKVRSCSPPQEVSLEPQFKTIV